MGAVAPTGAPYAWSGANPAAALARAVARTHFPQARIVLPCVVGTLPEGARILKWSHKLGTIAGIDLFVHVTFWLLLGWIAISQYLREHSVVAALSGVAFVVTVFGTVVLHELGHATMARRFGIRTKDITLYPTGGIARLEKMPDEPSQELLVALAGPAVNVVLGAVAFGALALLQKPLLPGTAFSANAPFLLKFAWVNVTMAIFNLLPAFPMDGGRALRALLAMRTSYVQATRTAAAVGRMMALAFGLIGLFSNPMLIVIAIFVWSGAGAEAAEAQSKAALAGLPIRAAMITDFHSLASTDTLAVAIERLLASTQTEFPVVDDGVLVGMLTRDELLVALASPGGGQEASVGSVMRRNVPTVDPSETLEKAIAHLYESDCPTLPVVRDGNVIGLLALAHIGDLLMVQGALREHDATAGAARFGRAPTQAARPT